MNKKIAIDTNVLIYARDVSDSYKFKIAMDILDESPVVSSQVATEYLNVVKRLFKISKQECMKICLCDIGDCNFCPVALSTLQLANDLMLRYDFQMFDSIIVAAALESGCDILYSEDLQHNQLRYICQKWLVRHSITVSIS
jgi:predicted nucleic acid-binding protein